MPQGVLFVHNNFPGQFRDLAETLLARGVRCWAIAQNHASGMPNVRTAGYGLVKGTTDGIFPLAVRAEADLIPGSQRIQRQENRAVVRARKKERPTVRSRLVAEKRRGENGSRR